MLPAKKKNVRYIQLEKQKAGVTLPVLYERKEQCCGCTACYASCPVHAIQMQPDIEGFLYPVVDASLCLGCGKCVKNCVFQKEQQAKQLV